MTALVSRPIAAQLSSVHLATVTLTAEQGDVRPVGGTSGEGGRG
jgi:hypothetical protein